MKIEVLQDIVKKVRAPERAHIAQTSEKESVNTEAKPIAPTPGHYGPNTVTGKGGGGIIGESWLPTQY